MTAQHGRVRAPSAAGVSPMARTAVQPSSTLTSRTPQAQITAPNYTQLPGAAQSAAASPDGSLYVVSNASGGPGGNTLWHYVNGNWSQIPGAAIRLAVGPDATLWALTVQGGIYHFQNGAWSTMAGGASDITIGADGSVYVIANDNCCLGGSSIWHYVAGQWTELPGAGLRIAASLDATAYPSAPVPHGFYVTTAQNTIYYYNPASSAYYTALTGAAVQVAPTVNGGFFVLGGDSGAQKTIWYHDLSSDVWTQEPGLGANLALNGTSLYVVAANGGIFVANVSPVGNLTATPTPTANPTPTPPPTGNPTPTPPPSGCSGTVCANPASLTFYGIGQSQSVTLTQSGNSTFSVNGTTCATAGNGAATYTLQGSVLTVTAQGVGRCALTVQGAQSATVAIGISITTSSVQFQ